MKITKRQYQAQKSALEAKLAAVEKALEDANNTNGNSLWTVEMDSESEIFEAWDKLHDAKTDTENELRDLESTWNTRNWTAGDWNSWELVAANIDAPADTTGDPWSRWEHTYPHTVSYAQNDMSILGVNTDRREALQMQANPPAGFTVLRIEEREQ